jgi:hypothetical protein
MGVSADNVLSGGAPQEMERQLLEARLQLELSGRSAQGLSEAEVARDWDLLQKTMAEGDSPVSVRLAPHVENIRGNQP